MSSDGFYYRLGRHAPAPHPTRCRECFEPIHEHQQQWYLEDSDGREWPGAHCSRTCVMLEVARLQRSHDSVT